MGVTPLTSHMGTDLARDWSDDKSWAKSCHSTPSIFQTTMTTKAAALFQLLLLLFCSGTSPPRPAQAQPQLSESIRPQPQVLLNSFLSSLIYQESGVLYAFQLGVLEKENVKSGNSAKQMNLK